MHVCFYMAYNVMYIQVTESLSDMFKSEKRVLDTTATIELNADPFPYELVFNWVHDGPNCLINHMSCTSCETKFHALLGERLSNHNNQYKSSICLPSPV
jgi:hypothetical protein